MHNLVYGMLLSLIVVGARFGNAEVEAATTKRFDNGTANNESQATGDSEAV